MKQMISGIAVCLFLIMTSAFISQSGGPLTKQSDGTYVVNTTTLAQDVKGYLANTPLKIYIKKDKITKIEALANQETPKFFQRVTTAMLHKWIGKSVKVAQKLKVDGVTGATMSSNAVKENVARGLDYYSKNK